MRLIKFLFLLCLTCTACGIGVDNNGLWYIEEGDDKYDLLCVLVQNWLAEIEYRPSRARNCFGCDTSVNGWKLGDLKTDGIVNMEDFVVLAENW